MSMTNRIVTIGLAALLSAGIAASVVACDAQSAQDGTEYVGICVDPNTGMRAPDQNCGGENDLGAAVAAAFVWDYIDTYRYPTYVLPAYGTRVNITNITIVHTLPRGSSVTRSVPRTGGSASSVRTAAGSGGRSSTSGGRTNPGITRGGIGVPRNGSSGSAGSGSRSGGGHR